MQINQILSQARQISSDSIGIEVLLCHALKCGKEQLIMNARKDVDEAALCHFNDLLRRFNDGEPVAYITKTKEFYGLDFYVDKRVLIPRPETELLVDKVLELSGGKKTKVLDIGTGCGCIAVAVAKNSPLAEVTAVEISSEALEVAKLNAAKNSVSIRFIQSDLMNSVQDKEFDIIVANLPYIGTEKFNFVSREAKAYEPNVALFGGTDGLELYRKLFSQIAMMDKKPQFLLGEFGFLQHDLMMECLKKYFPDAEISILKDLALIDRVFLVKF